MKKTLLLCALLFAAWTGTVNAAVRISTPTGGNWTTGSTWVGGVAPANTDSAIIATTGGNSVTISANVTNAGLTVSSTAILAINGTSIITENGNVVVNGTVNGSTGTIRMNVNGLTLNGTGTINSIVLANQNCSFLSTANLTINNNINSPGRTVTNNGTVTLNGNYARTGGTAIWTQGTNAILNISGIFTPSANVTLNASAAGNTINYDGGAQAVEPATYTNLIFSGSGAKTIVTGTSIGGTLSIAPTGNATASVGAGLTITANALTLGGLGRINGTWGSTSSAATYKDDAYFAATTGIISVASDTRTNQATLSALATPSTVPYGTTSTVSSSGGSGTGAVTFSIGTSTGCALNGTTLSVIDAAGTCSVTATKAADTAYFSATSVPFAVTLVPAPTYQLFLNAPGSATVGTRLGFTVTRKDQYGNLRTASNETFYPYTYSTGTAARFYDAASGGNIVTAITIPNGTSSAQFWYYDELAGTATITASDNATAPDGNAGIIDATSTATFVAGASTQFSITQNTTMTAGVRLGYAVTRKDPFGNVVTAGTSTAYLYSSSAGAAKKFYDAASGGNIVTAITIPNGTSSAQFWYYDELAGTATITASDNATAPDGNAGIIDATNVINILPAATHAFLLNNPGGMQVGTRLGYTATRQDAFGNAVTAGTNTVYLYSNSTGAKAFYNVSTGGSPVTSVTIGSGVSSASFWYYDDAAGTWTITASDNATAPDGPAGIVDGTQSVAVSPAPIIATRFTIVKPTDNVVGATVAVTIRAEDNSGNLATTYSNSVTLVTSGHATPQNGVVVSVTNGVGSTNITDTYAETVTLSLIDSATTTLDVSSTQTVTFSPGVTAQYILNTPGNMTAGTRLGYTVTRKDQFGNLVTSGNETVYLYSSAAGGLSAFYDASSGGNLISSISIASSSSVANFWYYEGKAGTWTISASDNATTPDGATGIVDGTRAVVVSPAATSQFLLNNPGNMTAGTRLGFTVSREDAFGNAVTAGTNAVYLYANPSVTSAFYNVSTGGSPVTSVTIGSGVSSASFWYYDNTAHLVTVSCSDNPSAPDGAIGIADASRSITVSSAPIVATRLTILQPTDALINTNVTVTIRAEDTNGNVDTTFNGSVTLVTSGSATGGGVVNFVSGVGTKLVTDAIPETVTLSLLDSASTSLDVSSIKTVTFSTTPPPPTPATIGGITAVIRSTVIFAGKVFPGANLTVVAVSDGNIPVRQGTVAAADGSFTIRFAGIAAGIRNFFLAATDRNGKLSQTKTYAVDVNQTLIVRDVLLPPTVDFVNTTVTKGGFVGITGYATPGYAVTATVDGKDTGLVSIADNSGKYLIPFNTFDLALGTHSVSTQQTSTDGDTSGTSPEASFVVSTLFDTRTDLNHDGKVDASDMSIFMSRWLSSDPSVRKTVDFNGDGILDAQDLSIFARTLTK